MSCEFQGAFPLANEFLEDGVVSFGKILKDSECDKAVKLVIDSRPWDKSIFREYDEVFGSKRHLNVIPLICIP